MAENIKQTFFHVKKKHQKTPKNTNFAYSRHFQVVVEDLERAKSQFQ